MQIKKVRGTILFKNAKVIDPFNEKIYKADILVDRGRIKSIRENISPDGIDEIIDLKGLNVSPGFIDIHVHFREPGREDKETIESGTRAALAGGFTQVCCMPNTDPAIDSQEGVRFILRKAEGLLVDVYPIAAITRGRKGKELTEMVEISEVGAVAFSDDGAPLENSLIMRHALEYSKIVDKPIVNHAEDVTISNGGIMNEGVVSTQLGLKGNPSLAEEIMVYRDLALARFTKAKIHIPHVTTAAAARLIRNAKEEGVRVTSEVTPHHFSLTDEFLRSFDTNGKVAPPLRTESDISAIIEGLKDGTIDVIASDHAPHTSEAKETSIDLASFGIIGLESTFSLAMTNLVHKKHLTLIELIKKLTINPAKVMSLKLLKIEEGEIAGFTIFDPDEWWVFSKKDIYSKSKNTPFLGSEFVGRVKSVFSKSHFIIL